MGMFSGIEEAQGSEGGIYVIPGIYEVRIKQCKSGTTRKRLDFFVANLEILKSDNADRRAGGEMTWFVGIKADTPALGNIREFIAIAENVEVAEVTEEVSEYVVSDVNPLEGAVLKCIATDRLTKNGGHFTLCKWIHISKASVKA